MRKFLIILAAFILLIPNHSHAEGGTFGKKRLIIGAGLYRPGNAAIRSFDSSGIAVTGGIGIPVNTNIDVVGGFGYNRLSNNGATVNTTNISGRLLYHFETEGALKPAVLIGGTYVNAEASAVGFSQNDSEFGFSVGLAIETNLSEGALLSAQADYFRIAGSSDISVGGDLTVWLSDTVFLPISLAYAFDEGDFLFGVSLGFSF